MRVPPDRLHIVKTVLAQYLAQPVYGDTEFAERHRALPLYMSWTGAIYLTTAGEFWFHTSDEDPPQIENDLSDSEKLVALSIAAERYPELAQLLPPRPAGVPDCEECRGTGRMDLANLPNLICGHCNALGWRAEPADEQPPPFEVALVDFRSFVQRLGLPAEVVFASAEDALLARRRLYLTRLTSEAEARQAYERAAARRLGVAIGALGELPDGRLCAFAYGPSTRDEQRQLMYPGGLKMTAPLERVAVRLVGRMVMWLLRLRHGSRGVARTREYFR